MWLTFLTFDKNCDFACSARCVRVNAKHSSTYIDSHGVCTLYIFYSSVDLDLKDMHSSELGLPPATSGSLIKVE